MSPLKETQGCKRAIVKVSLNWAEVPGASRRIAQQLKLVIGATTT